MKDSKIKRYDAFFAILKEFRSLGVKMSKEKLLREFSEGMRSGLRELSDFEYEKLLDFTRYKLQETRKGVNEKCNKQRRKIIALLVKVGYVKLNNHAQVVSDMPRIHEWIQKYGYLHKPLNHYTIKELPKLVSQVEARYKSHLEND